MMDNFRADSVIFRYEIIIILVSKTVESNMTKEITVSRGAYKFTENGTLVSDFIIKIQ